MKENIRLRLWGVIFLGMMIMSLVLGLSYDRFLNQVLGFIGGGCFLLSFLIINYHIYRLETKKEK